MICTLIAGWFLLLPEDLETLGESAISQTLLSANIYFWRTTNYFAGANNEKPLLHMWSLAVEEQFYIILPVILIVLLRRQLFRNTYLLFWALLAGMLMSFGISVWGVKHQPFATFFLLPTRAWELLCGSLIATEAFPVARSHIKREVAAWFGLVAIFVPIALYNEATEFPGPAALLPCLGTTLFIWANRISPHDLQCSPTIAARILSMRGFTFIGLISYSLYLWHWPVIAYTNYWKTAPLSVAIRSIIVVISLVLAVLSWRFVEIPFRRKLLLCSRKSLFGMAACISLAFLIFGMWFVVMQGHPDRISLSSRVILQDIQEASLRRQRANDAQIDVSDIERGNVYRIAGKDTVVRPDFLLLGDSHAGVALPAFEFCCRKYGLSGAAITHSATPPVFGWRNHREHAHSEPDQLWQAALDYAKREEIKEIFLVAFWSTYVEYGSPQELHAMLKNTIEKLESSGARVWVILDVPTYPFDVPRVLLKQSVLPYLSPVSFLQTESEHIAKNQVLYDLKTEYSSSMFLDPAMHLLNPATGEYIVSNDGRILYFDGNHLTIHGVDLALRPTVQRAFAEIKATLKPE